MNGGREIVYRFYGNSFSRKWKKSTRTQRSNNGISECWKDGIMPLKSFQSEGPRNRDRRSAPAKYRRVNLGDQRSEGGSQGVAAGSAFSHSLMYSANLTRSLIFCRFEYTSFQSRPRYSCTRIFRKPAMGESFRANSGGSTLNSLMRRNASW